MRHDAALASSQGKHFPAFKGSRFRASVRSHCRGHGNKLLFELANSLAFLLEGEGREKLAWCSALLCSAAGFVVPDLIKGCVGGSAEGKEKGEKRSGGSRRQHCKQRPALVCGGCCPRQAGGGRSLARPQVSSSLSSPLGSEMQS